MSTFKYKKFTPENVNYCEDFLSYFRSPYKLKFFDEAGFALPSVGKANYGHSLANHPCVEISKHLCFPNVTLNMLIGLRGNLYANTEDGATETFLVKQTKRSTSLTTRRSCDLRQLCNPPF